MGRNSEEIIGGKQGMNRDTHPSSLTEKSYTFMLNGNYEDTDGNTIQLQNEHSNILCTGFKEGYKVVGYKVDNRNDKVYFFLTNPDTGLSEIGCVKNITCIDNAVAMEVECGCDVKVILDSPLEEQTQVPLCNYETIIEDCEENKCLAFDICHPFKEGNIQLKQEKCGDTLYFTDGVNPPRYLKLDDLDIYYEEGFNTDCDTPVPTCLDCEKMRIFPLYEKPCLEPITLQAGGNLQAGMYEVLIAYTDELGNELSPYFSITQPIPIFDLNNNILDQSLLGYETNFGIRLNVSGLDNSFSNYKAAVIFRNGLDGAVRYFEEGIHLITDDSIVLTSLRNKRETTRDNLFIGRTFYETSEGMTSGNGFLFQYGLTAKSELNLQPVVNLMGAFAKWVTVRAEEDIYQDPILTAKYKTAMRDEVYPYGIKFFTTDGYGTAVFPFIARPAINPIGEDGEEDPLASIPNIKGTTDSLDNCAPNCSETDRDKRWQVFNTATVDGICEAEEGEETETYTTSVELQCIVEEIINPGAEDEQIIPKELATLSGTFCFESINPDLNFPSFLNSNLEALKDSSSDLSLVNSSNPTYATLVDIMDDSDNDYPSETCTPEGEGDCTLNPDLSQNILVAYDSGNLVLDTTPEGELDFQVTTDTDPTKYESLNTPANCQRLVTPITDDTTFIDDYMVPTSTVYQTNTVSNETCATAEVTPRTTPAVPNLFTTVYLRNAADTSLGGFADATFSNLEDLATPTEEPFFQGLHKGARWYSGVFLGQPSMVLQTTALTACGNPDDLNTSTSVRISTYADCGSTVAIQSEIVDLSIENLFIVDNTTGAYPNDTFYYTVEPAARVEVEYDIQLQGASLQIDLSGTSGFADIDVDGIINQLIFSADLPTTASNFVTAVGGLIGTTTVTANGASLIFTDPDPLPPITITNTAGTLDGTIVPGEVEIDIDGSPFTVQYTNNLADTASLFVSTHQTDIEALGMYVDVTGDTIHLRGNLTQYNNTVVNTLVASLSGTITLDREIYLATPPCECFGMVLKTPVLKYSLGFQDLAFYKQMTYTGECDIEVPKYNGCEPSNYQYGKFSYWESTETYPCNDELYNSQTLTINQNDLPVDIQSDFEQYYVDVVGGGGEYTLNSATDFKDKPIRHYKYPCNIISPFMERANRGAFQETFVYPIGFDISPEVINAFLDIAVNNELISAEERAKITKYEIYRGDRRTHKTVVAKGLLFDMYKYSEEGENIFYPNFPYNDLGIDELHNREHPFGGKSQDRFTFHSPDTHFSKPPLGTELKVEGFQFGKSRGKFTQVDGHPEWVILGQPAYTLAGILTAAEIGLELLATAGAYFLEASSAPLPSQPIAIPVAIALGINAAIGIATRAGSINSRWLQTFKDLGDPQNFAYYYTSYGFYNYFIANTEDLYSNVNDKQDNIVRAVCTSRYLREGRIAVTDEVTSGVTRINNVDREQSVYIGLGSGTGLDYPSLYYKYDSDYSAISSRFTSSAILCEDNEVARNVASPYIALKNYVPDQYGRVDSVNWLTTSFCGELTTEVSDCTPAFGGDTFISRFSWKRKMPMFLTTAVGSAPLLPFSYEIHKNLPTLQYYVNYETTGLEDTGFGSYLFPTNRTKTDYMDCFDKAFYIKPPTKFYLYYYGIPYFLVESELNTWLRYGKREPQERFYPQVGDYVNWTQETNVSIREPNQFFYNPVYSLSPTRITQRVLPETYDKELYDCIYDAPNGVIYSLLDVSENSIADPWLVFRPLDKYEFPTRYGNLVDLSVIQSSQLMGRFEDQVVVYNRFNSNYRQTIDTAETGNGSLFTANRPVEFNSTELGYMGTQHRAMVSCEYGHFWVDAKRGHVFQFAGGEGAVPVEITQGLRNWFKEHLPFKILQSSIDGLTSEDLDNNFNSLGIAMGWDSRYRRVFITKKDYKVKDGCNTTIRYEDCKFYNDLDEEISLLDDTYFEDCSWTIAYSPITKSWISYYSFKPDYYIPYQNYFQTGINNSSDSTEVGLWSHLLTNESYQVFYGKLYPWTIELPIKENFRNGILHNVTYWLDVRKYWDRYDFAERDDLGFTKAWIYNNCKNSGQLNLIPSEANNLRQKMDYPKYNTDSIDILATNKYKKWTFNHIYDITKNQNQNIAIWLNDCNQIEKELNPLAIKYKNAWKNKLQGDWFLSRLQQDKESRFKFIFKWEEAKRNNFDG